MSILDSLCEDEEQRTAVKVVTRDTLVELLQQLRRACRQFASRDLLADTDSAISALQSGSLVEAGGFGTDLGQITVDDLKAVGLQPKQSEPAEELLTTAPATPTGDDKIPMSAAVTAPLATPAAEEDIPASVIDATNVVIDDTSGISKLVQALRTAHKASAKKPAATPSEIEGEGGAKHAESFDEMGSGDYRQLMLEARRKRSSNNA